MTATQSLNAHIGFGVQTALNTAVSRTNFIEFQAESGSELQSNKSYQKVR